MEKAQARTQLTACHSTLDENFSLVSEAAFQDHDVLMLFDLPEVMQQCMRAGRITKIL
jgi:hypothetical protein